MICSYTIRKNYLTLTLCTLGRGCCVWGNTHQEVQSPLFHVDPLQKFWVKTSVGRNAGSKRIYRQTRHLNPFEQKHIFRHFNFFLFFLPRRGQFLSILSLVESAQYCGIDELKLIIVFIFYDTIRNSFII